ncbi:unnamed protein product, partial [Staurois parvus]
SGHALYCPQSLVIHCTVHSLWSSPVLSAVSDHLLYCPQSLVHLLYCVHSLWSISCTVSAVSGPSPVVCPQSLVISCSMPAVSGHLLYCVRSLWSSPVVCPQSLVISCSMLAVSGHLL